MCSHFVGQLKQVQVLNEQAEKARAFHVTVKLLQGSILNPQEAEDFSNGSKHHGVYHGHRLHNVHGDIFSDRKLQVVSLCDSTVQRGLLGERWKNGTISSS